jgi:hypothetical protein
MKRSSIHVLRSTACQPLLLAAQQILGNALDAEEVVADVIAALVRRKFTRKELLEGSWVFEEVLAACNERLGMPGYGPGNRADNDVEDDDDDDDRDDVDRDDCDDFPFGAVGAANDNGDVP